MTFFRFSKKILMRFITFFVFGIMSFLYAGAISICDSVYENSFKCNVSSLSEMCCSHRYNFSENHATPKKCTSSRFACYADIICIEHFSLFCPDELYNAIAFFYGKDVSHTSIVGTYFKACESSFGMAERLTLLGFLDFSQLAYNALFVAYKLKNFCVSEVRE